MSDKKFCFGLKKSKIDPTDHIVSFNYEKIDFSSKFSLKDRVKQVYDQLNLNSCSANATANFLSLSDKTNVLNVLIVILVGCIYIFVLDGLIIIIFYHFKIKGQL